MTTRFLALATPGTPLVLFQSQWLDSSCDGQSLGALRGTDGAQLFFIPFEHQLLLLGFAVLAIPKDFRLENEDYDSLAILQRQASVSMYAAWLIRDLSEQRDTLQTQAGALEQANLALREADQLKSEFLALTSHELRTPLTGILGFTRLVMDKLYEDEAKKNPFFAKVLASQREFASRVVPHAARIRPPLERAVEHYWEKQ